MRYSVVDFSAVWMHEMPAADIENFAAGQFMKTFGCLQKQNPFSKDDKSTSGIYSAKVMFGWSEFRYLQDTCEGSAGIRGKCVVGEEGGPDHILGGSCLGNQTRRQDSGAVDGR